MYSSAAPSRTRPQVVQPRYGTHTAQLICETGSIFNGEVLQRSRACELQCYQNVICWEGTSSLDVLVTACLMSGAWSSRCYFRMRHYGYIAGYSLGSCSAATGFVDDLFEFPTGSFSFNGTALKDIDLQQVDYNCLDGIPDDYNAQGLANVRFRPSESPATRRPVSSHSVDPEFPATLNCANDVLSYSLHSPTPEIKQQLLEEARKEPDAILLRVFGNILPRCRQLVLRTEEEGLWAWTWDSSCAWSRLCSSCESMHCSQCHYHRGVSEWHAAQLSVYSEFFYIPDIVQTEWGYCGMPDVVCMAIRGQPTRCIPERPSSALARHKPDTYMFSCVVLLLLALLLYHPS